MAVKFLANGDGIADLVAANMTVFPSRTPEGFIELVDGTGQRRLYRYRLIPQLGEVELSKDHAATLPPDFLIAEFDGRLKTGPVVFTLVFQFAGPNDPTDDPSRAWPEHRQLCPAGHFVISGRSADETHWQKSVFDPARLASGVERSGDPVLAFRPGAYSVSATRRLKL